jgi:hypothetical protein
VFQEACKDYQKILMPIVFAWRELKGKKSREKLSIGVGLVVNDAGWFVTAGHILKLLASLNAQVNGGEPRKRTKDGYHLTHYAPIFGAAGVLGGGGHLHAEEDLAICKLDNYDPKGQVFPKFRTTDVEQGELLCRLGYPFVENIKVKWSQEKGFEFTNLFPIPVFANEALVSRFLGLPSGGSWIETSSPGLKGQSGGPLIDPDGLVCGIHVNTAHSRLDFEGDGRNQVLNAGRAVDVKTVRRLLDAHSVAYDM